MENVVICSVNRIIRGGRVWICISTFNESTMTLETQTNSSSLFVVVLLFHFWIYAGLCSQSEIKTSGFWQRQSQHSNVYKTLRNIMHRIYSVWLLSNYVTFRSVYAHWWSSNMHAYTHFKWNTLAKHWNEDERKRGKAIQKSVIYFLCVALLKQSKTIKNIGLLCSHHRIEFEVNT